MDISHKNVKKEKIGFLGDFDFLEMAFFFLQKITLRKTSSIGDFWMRWKVSCCKQATERTLLQE